MSDARYDVYQHYGTNAERLLFVPDPPVLTGVQPIYIWYETDTGDTWLYHTSWTQVASGGGAPAPDTLTYLTEADETGSLPNSRQVLAGAAIAFDDTTPGERTISVPDDAITFAKMQNINTQVLIGRNTAGTGSPEEVTISQALDWLGE